MKKRLYQKQVIDAEKKWAKLADTARKELKWDIAAMICMGIIVILSVMYSPWLKMALVPFVIRTVIPYLGILKMESEIVSLISIDRQNFTAWMSLHEGKITSEELESACQLYDCYKEIYIEKHDELKALLNEQLKIKPGKPLVVCVLAGLIFLSNDEADYSLLFKSRYNYGPKGNMIPDIWIRLLNPQKEELTKSYFECAEDFKVYWEKKCK